MNLPVCTVAGEQQWPKIVADGSGGAIVAWQDPRAGVTNNDIYAQHVTSTGATDPVWPGNGRLLCAATGQQWFPTLASDGAGGAIVSWQDQRTGEFDIYAQRVKADGAVDPLWPADGRALCTASGDQTNPVPLADGAGGVIVAWQDRRSGTNYDLYAQHLLASGAVDPSWPADGQAICAAAGDQLSPRLVPDGAGGAVISWQDRRTGDFDVYAHHLLPSGALDPAWPVDGRALCVAANDQQVPTITRDGVGGAIVTWQDFRSGTNYDVYVQHVLASGAVDAAWPANGRQLVVNAADQNSPVIVSDGVGGGVVIWVDTRNSGTTGWDVFAHRVLASGAVDPAWPANGRALCLAVGNQENLVAISDGAGGAIAGWQDRRVDYDIYAQHVSIGGVVDAAWPVDGRAVSIATDTQLTPMMAPDGVGGAILTWQDHRNGADLDMYAQRVQPNGQLGGNVVGVPTNAPGLSLAPIYPSPARGRMPRVYFALENDAPAVLECIDVGGHRVASEEVGSRGPGRHSVDLTAGRKLRSGVYWFRLRQGARASVQRVVLLD